MSELAFNLNGDPFEIPPGAVAWRVRKMKHKGAPEVAYGRNGQPLVLPLEADVDDLRAEVTTSGRYRVDPIDENQRPIEGAQSGYVYVHELSRAVEHAATPAPAAQASTLAPLPAASDSVVIEAMRMNAEIARAVVCKLPQMFEAGAQLLRAADGAGLPSRPPVPYAVETEDDDDDQDDAEAPAPTSPLNELFSQLAKLLPVAAAVLANGKFPGLGEMFDWRKAAAANDAASTPKVKAIASATVQTAASAPVSDEPQITPVQMAHFFAIQSALSSDEAAVAREVAGQLSANERRAWMDELCALSVADAVTKIRTLIGGKKEKVS